MGINDCLHCAHLVNYRIVQTMLLLIRKKRKRRWMKMINHSSHDHHQNDQLHGIQAGCLIQMKTKAILVRR